MNGSFEVSYANKWTNEESVEEPKRRLKSVPRMEPFKGPVPEKEPVIDLLHEAALKKKPVSIMETLKDLLKEINKSK